MDNKINKTDIAWLAGLIDGEGCIAIYKMKENRPKEKGQFRYGFRLRPALYISNCDTLIVAEVERIIKGILADCKTSYRIEHLKSSPRQNVNYCFRINARNSLICILDVVVPYLVGKKAQAQVLLSLLKKGRPQHGRWCSYTRAELEAVDILKSMKKQNIVSVLGNAELSRDNKISQACVENIQAIPLFEL